MVGWSSLMNVEPAIRLRARVKRAPFGVVRRGHECEPLEALVIGPLHPLRQREPARDLAGHDVEFKDRVDMLHPDADKVARRIGDRFVGGR